MHQCLHAGCSKTFPTDVGRNLHMAKTHKPVEVVPTPKKQIQVIMDKLEKEIDDMEEDLTNKREAFEALENAYDML